MKVTVHRTLVVRITRLGKTALYCFSVITVGTGCNPFFKVGRNVGRGRIKKSYLGLLRIPPKCFNTSISAWGLEPRKEGF